MRLRQRRRSLERANTRLVIFGTVKAKNGKSVLTVLDLRPIEGNLVVEDKQKINSAIPKRPIQSTLCVKALFFMLIKKEPLSCLGQ